MRQLLKILMLAIPLLLAGCGYNDFQTRDEQVKAAWAEVLNQYKRRADLIPNLVQTVQGYAAQERDVPNMPPIRLPSSSSDRSARSRGPR